MRFMHLFCIVFTLSISLSNASVSSFRRLISGTKLEHAARLLTLSAGSTRPTDYVGAGTSFEGYNIYSGFIEPTDSIEKDNSSEEVNQDLHGCPAIIKSAFDACHGKNRCAAPRTHKGGDESWREKEQTQFLSTECAHAFDLANQKSCFDVDIDYSHKKHIRHEKISQKIKYKELVQILSDDNVCACGGPVSEEQFKHIVTHGCLGHPGIPMNLLTLLVLLTLFFWFLMYINIVRYLNLRHKQKYNKNPTCCVRVCHLLCGIPVTCMFFNFIFFFMMVLGPFFWFIILFLYFRMSRLRQQQLLNNRNTMIIGYDTDDSNDSNDLNDSKTVINTKDNSIIVDGVLVVNPCVVNETIHQNETAAILTCQTEEGLPVGEVVHEAA